MVIKVEMIKPIREKLGMTQEEFATEIGVGVRSISKWETGKVQKIHRAARLHIERLANKAGVRASWL